MKVRFEQRHQHVLINGILNNVRQHNYFIIQGNYTGYMFQLLLSHFQAYFIPNRCEDDWTTVKTHSLCILCNKVVVLTYII